MKKILISIILVNFLSSCTTNPIVTHQCSINLVYKDADNIDAKKTTCYCREFEFTKDHVGPNGVGWLEPDLKQCNLMVGFPIKEYPHVNQFWQDVRSEIAGHSDKKERRDREKDAIQK